MTEKTTAWVDEHNRLHYAECANTDQELWREPANGDYYSDSIHVTQDGGVGINVGGHVIVKTLREWHSLATEASKWHQKYMEARDHGASHD